MYPKHQPDTSVPASPSLPALEREVLDYWAGDKTFQASIDTRDPGPKGANEFVFYDGPPFANGLPHYGHLLTGYVKDVVPRYQTLRGRRVGVLGVGHRWSLLLAQLTVVVCEDESEPAVPPRLAPPSRHPLVRRL